MKMVGYKQSILMDFHFRAVIVDKIKRHPVRSFSKDVAVQVQFVWPSTHPIFFFFLNIALAILRVSL